ncbi:MAG TPA: NADH-quinone oxidoreductase subunit C [Verrucomicrobiota bacterium]|nr:MAG: NADH-quinone oxidoreductase chain 5 [Verrucomicrobia bacterium ADurb.Bin118]HPY31593.1 NADH-quinone oxidoreductase subunit C [Verrucomicrobiota bacterium]HQB15889.1 NADH-quinone oxidoreductase subunit C [Verrucomicrobiota bacterium]
METLAQIKARIEAAVAGAVVEMVPNDSPSGQHSLWVDNSHAVAVAQFLREDPELRFDFCSNVTGVDWPETERTEKVKTTRLVDGVETSVEEIRKTKRPGFLEVVYHLYSVALKHGPLILRLRTENRSDQVQVPSLTPVWRGCEFQEREVFDLFGVVFTGHPDLRRILMWDEFTDHPMRKDYVEPDDYEYEPTPHDEVLVKARRSGRGEAGT